MGLLEYYSDCLYVTASAFVIAGCWNERKNAGRRGTAEPRLRTLSRLPDRLCGRPFHRGSSDLKPPSLLNKHCAKCEWYPYREGRARSDS